jgi:hypothetical protein
MDNLAIPLVYDLHKQNFAIYRPGIPGSRYTPSQRSVEKKTTRTSTDGVMSFVKIPFILTHPGKLRSCSRIRIFVYLFIQAMRPKHLKDLKERNFLSDAQFHHLEPIYSNKVISVFYELRIILYLGVMLFTAGIGILIYKNIGDLGHLAMITVLFVLTAWCFQYALKHVPAFTRAKFSPPTPYFDYIVLLGCLLFISVLGYLQFQYERFDDGMGLTTLVTAAFFFFGAYRFDHLGVLSLAITALASFWSISISPQKWYSGDFLNDSNLHNTALVFAVALATAGLVLDRRKMKKHFTFTYLNFSALIFLVAALSGMFIEDDVYPVYLMLLYAGCTGVAYYAYKNKLFLFMVYAMVFAYIGTTYLLTDIINDIPGLWFLYLLASCGGFIFFIIRFKSYFRRAV